MLSSSTIESSIRAFKVRLIVPLDERLFLDFDLRAEDVRGLWFRGVISYRRYLVP